MPNSITLTDIPANTVFAGDRASPSIAVAGTVTNGTSTNIQAQVIEAGDLNAQTNLKTVTDLRNVGSTVVVAWTTILTNPPTGAYSGTLTVPKHSTMLQLQVRLSDLSASANGSNIWGVGYIFALIGQSNMSGMWIFGSGSTQWPPDPRANVYIPAPSVKLWQPAGSQASAANANQISYGDGLLSLGNSLCAMLNAPVGFILGAVGGTALDPTTFGLTGPDALFYWLHLGGNSANYPLDYLFQAVADAITAMNGDVSGIAWMQGEGEVIVGTLPQATYQTDLQTLYNNILAVATKRTTANCFFHVGIIGFQNYQNSYADTIRQAQINVGLQGGGFKLGPCIYDLAMQYDGYVSSAPNPIHHHNYIGMADMGRRWAMSLAYWAADATPGTYWGAPGSSPRIISATRQGKYINLKLSQPVALPAPVTLTTSASTSSGNILTFLSTTGVIKGMACWDNTTPSAIPNGLTGTVFVTGVTSTQVSLSGNVAATVGLGDSITFSNNNLLGIVGANPATIDPATSQLVSIYGFKFSTDNFVTTLPAPTLIRPADPNFGNAGQPGGVNTQLDVTDITVVLQTDPGRQVQIAYQCQQPSVLNGGFSEFVSFFSPIASVVHEGYGSQQGYGVALEPTVGSRLPLLPVTTALPLLTQDVAPDNFGNVPIFPTLLGLGWSVKRMPMFNTNLQENISGKQVGIAYWSAPKYKWELTFNFLRLSTSNPEFQQLLSFFNGVSGRLGAFLYIDTDDNQVVNQLIAVGDGSTTTFQLYRTIGTEGTGEAILAPNFQAPAPVTATSPAIYINGNQTTSVQWFPYGTNVSGASPGTIKFANAPPYGALITATFWWYWPVRFDDDKMDFEKFMTTLYKNGKVTFTSVKN